METAILFAAPVGMVGMVVWVFCWMVLAMEEKFGPAVIVFVAPFWIIGLISMFV